MKTNFALEMKFRFHIHFHGDVNAYYFRGVSVHSLSRPSRLKFDFYLINPLQDAKISLDAYRALEFDGAVELGNMFEFYVRGSPDRDVEATRALNPAVMCFDDWVKANKEKLDAVFK